MSDGGIVLEHHTVDFFPERWFDLVLVLRCDNTILYDRLASRYENFQSTSFLCCFKSVVAIL